MARVFRFRCKPGVYKMINTVTGNIYIGSSKNVSHRIKTHKYMLRRGYKSNIRISTDLKKYGHQSFDFESLEYCLEENIKDREQYYFELLKPYYNVWNNVYSAAGRSYTEEQMKTSFVLREIKDKESFRSKLKLAWEKRKLRPDGIATLNMLNRTGKKHSEETKKKMSINRKGKPKSTECKQKMRKWRLGTKWDPFNKTWVKGGNDGI